MMSFWDYVFFSDISVVWVCIATAGVGLLMLYKVGKSDKIV